MRNSKTSFRIFFFFFSSYANRISQFKLISCYGCDNSHQICEIRKILSAFFSSFHMRTEFFDLNWYHVTDVIIHIKYAKFENFFPHFFFSFHMRTEFLDLNWYHVTDVIIHIKYAKFENFFPHFFFFSYANRIFRYKLISCYGCDNSHQICEIRKLLSSLFFFHMRREFLDLNWYHVTDVIIHIKYAKFENFFPHFFSHFLKYADTLLRIGYSATDNFPYYGKFGKFFSLFLYAKRISRKRKWLILQ